VAAVGLERPPVGTDEVAHLFLERISFHLRGKELVDRNDQRRVADDSRLAVDKVRQLVEGVHAVLGARLLDVCLCLFQPFGVDAGGELGHRLLDG